MMNEDEVKRFYSDKGGHGFDHVERVHRMAMLIARREGADLRIVDAAAWLHDMARATEDETGKCHAEEGATMSRAALRKMGFPESKIPAVAHAISVHRFSKQKRAETLEAKILQDADRLDALGAICIARVFMYNGHRGLPLYDPGKKPEKHYHGQDTTAINHFYEKILKIKPELFHTKSARKIAKRRYGFVKEFLRRFKLEWNSKY